MTQDDLKDAVRKTAESVMETGHEAFDAAKFSVTDASAAAGAATRDDAEARAEAVKDMIPGEGQRLAKGLRAAAAGQGKDDLHNQLLDTVATSVSDLSEGLRGRSFGALLDEVDGFARRNPGAFVAAAALAGFVLAGFARRALIICSRHRKRRLCPFGTSPRLALRCPDAGTAIVSHDPANRPSAAPLTDALQHLSNLVRGEVALGSGPAGTYDRAHDFAAKRAALLTGFADDMRRSLEHRLEDLSDTARALTDRPANVDFRRCNEPDFGSPRVGEMCHRLYVPTGPFRPEHSCVYIV